MGDYGSPPGPSPASFLRGILRVLLSSMVTKKTGAKMAPVFLRLFATFGTESLQEVLDLVEFVAFRDFYRRDMRVIQTESLVT